MSETELKPCAFCGCAMKLSPHPVNRWAICSTEGCIGARQTIVLEDPKQVAAHNRRPAPPEAKALSAAVAALADKLDSDSYGVVDDDHTSGRLDAYRDVAEQLREMLAAHASTDAAPTQ
jgi:hypothetical protein